VVHYFRSKREQARHLGYAIVYNLPEPAWPVKDANSHDPSNLPIFLAGARYAHGRYAAHDVVDNAPLCNLFVNLLNHLGIQTKSFGTSTGTLQIEANCRRNRSYESIYQGEHP
jgi:hypothetical protein